jgi:cell shape-determining protein MreC
MELLEFIILALVLMVTLFLVYYFFRGQKGNISLTRPVESRVDEYLDRRFQSLVEEWQLVTKPRLSSFKEQRYRRVEQDEARIAELKNYELAMQDTLDSLEARLDALETELAQKGSAKK